MELFWHGLICLLMKMIEDIGFNLMESLISELMGVVEAPSMAMAENGGKILAKSTKTL